MDTRTPMPRRKGHAPVATLCVALLALLCSLYLTVEGQAIVVWAGLDAVYAEQAASCVVASNPVGRCGEQIAARRAATAAA